MNTRYEFGIEQAQQLDDADKLACFRDEFQLPEPVGGKECVYLCGHSLGPMPKAAGGKIEEELRQWANLGVRGHFDGLRPWLSYHRHAKAGLAELCGALESEVVAMNALTVNLHLLMQSFYRPNGQRRKIVIESTAFPSDRFAAISQIRSRGYDPDEDLLEWTPRAGEAELRMEDLEALLEDNAGSIALILLPGVQYYSGQLLDIEGLCGLARSHGAMIGLDLAHAVGNVPLELHRWSPDFAAWCSYKYLNGGPGAVGGAFVAERHFDTAFDGQLLGWWGHDEKTRLKMSPEFDAEQGADRWQLSTVSVLAMAPLLASLDLFQRAGLPALREKSQALDGYLRYLLQERFAGRVACITPPGSGSQASLEIVDPSIVPRNIPDALEALNAIVDWREPNVIRAAPIPLYNSFQDVWTFTDRLEQALAP